MSGIVNGRGDILFGSLWTRLAGRRRDLPPPLICICFSLPFICFLGWPFLSPPLHQIPSSLMFKIISFFFLSSRWTGGGAKRGRVCPRLFLNRWAKVALCVQNCRLDNWPSLLIELFDFFLLPLIRKIKENSHQFVLIYRDGLKQFTQKEVLWVFHTFASGEKLKACGILERGRCIQMS